MKEYDETDLGFVATNGKRHITNTIKVLDLQKRLKAIESKIINPRAGASYFIQEIGRKLNSSDKELNPDLREAIIYLTARAADQNSEQSLEDRIALSNLRLFVLRFEPMRNSVYRCYLSRQFRNINAINELQKLIE